ncbi:5-oxoprolinase subunit PxpA [Pseudofulvimonas gallinarii]|uniref:UPF0271 protein n=1 Tax=Pseudofulvimonas gallinarii TaxID=634155 RepID=A0A4R3LHS6_9GAMM|nr:5-oxoprolinase subunit PxpA [Pseudofulvimonas gallinarii]TCS99200.1 UPF0271 protein [Pseudofulvimonas gallinarii]THD13996.1 hypothetical protein B1808_05770 [Pseudofulvimonas gallinarii]
MTEHIDFNCDLGEGCGDDAAIVPCISSASIACGGHAGSEQSMREAVELCRAHGVAVGAHPSFVDREHFGRRELSMSPAAIHVLVTAQTRRLLAVCEQASVRLRHVKPHGALYNRAARDRDVADAVVAAVHALDPQLFVYALAGSELVHAARARGLQVAEEVFAERGYTAQGRLVPRGQPGDVIESVNAAMAQVRTMLRDGQVEAVGGGRVPIHADTLCLHGDRDDAAAFARALHETLRAEGFNIAAPGDHA